MLRHNKLLSYTSLGTEISRCRWKYEVVHFGKLHCNVRQTPLATDAGRCNNRMQLGEPRQGPRLTLVSQTGERTPKNVVQCPF